MSELRPAAAVPHCTLPSDSSQTIPFPASFCPWCCELGRLGLQSHSGVSWPSALGAPRAGHGRWCTQGWTVLGSLAGI